MIIDDVARTVLQQLEEAWNAGDGEAYGRVFTEDATFVNIQGALHHGAAAIGAGHHQIFTTIYAGSVNRMRLVDASQVADDVLVANSRHTLDCPHGPLAGTHEAMVTSVIVRSGEQWRIAASQTTLVAPQRAMAGAR